MNIHKGIERARLYTTARYYRKMKCNMKWKLGGYRIRVAKAGGGWRAGTKFSWGPHYKD